MVPIIQSGSAGELYDQAIRDLEKLEKEEG